MSGFDISGPAEFKPRLIGEGQNDAQRADGQGGLEGTSFADTLTSALNKVRSLQLESKEQTEALARGENVEVHDLMIAMKKSEVAFNLMLEVRNKILEAWQILSRSVN